MKKFLFATATAFALFTGAAFAGATENITGCATAPAQGSNFTVRIDPNCSLSNDLPDGPGITDIALAMIKEVIVDPVVPAAN